MPARPDLDPAELRPLLSSLWICDYEREPEALRYRLAGEDVNAIYGGSLRGVSMETLFGEGTRADAMDRMFSVVKRKLVLHQIGDIFSTRMRTGSGERLILPLAADGETPDAMVGATVYDWGGGSESLARQEMTATYTSLMGDSEAGPQRMTFAFGAVKPACPARAGVEPRLP